MTESRSKFRFSLVKIKSGIQAVGIKLAASTRLKSQKFEQPKTITLQTIITKKQGGGGNGNPLLVGKWLKISGALPQTQIG